jgi:acetyltransferase-like isoleucine patch superfamily enzyme
MMSDPTPLDRMRAMACNTKQVEAAPWLNHKTTHKNITSYIDPSAEVGEGSMAWHFSVILAKCRIGKDCSIGSGSELGRGTVIGDRSRIGAHVFLPPNTIIGADVFVGPGVTCTDDRHPKIPKPGDPPYTAEPPVIEDGACIGAGAVLLPGVRIGKNARVAAGTLVSKDVPEGVMVIGLPGRQREMPEGWNPSPLADDAVSPVTLSA